MLSIFHNFLLTQDFCKNSLLEPFGCVSAFAFDIQINSSMSTLSLQCQSWLLSFQVKTITNSLILIMWPESHIFAEIMNELSCMAIHVCLTSMMQLMVKADMQLQIISKKKTNMQE